MVKCLNCEEDFPKYLTQSVSIDTFPSLTEKAKKFEYTEVRVCETCYDKLADELPSSGSMSYIHPYFQNSQSEAKE